MKELGALAETVPMVKRPGLLLAAVIGALAFAGSASASNPFGVTVVRFLPGTSPAQMRSAVSAAGGAVVGDLSPVGALAAVPTSSGFAQRIQQNPVVTAEFEDVMMARARGDVDEHGGGRAPDVDGHAGVSLPDPWHDFGSFLGVTNPEGILQWDDGRMHVPAAWATTSGDRQIVVAVLDTGVDAEHRELQSVVDQHLGGNFIPCADLRALFGLGFIDRSGLRDCRDGDFEGHGTWVASRIAGELNGFASNGVAPRVQLSSYKVLASGFGALPDWILAGMLAACSDGVDLVNVSITGYLDPANPTGAQTYLLFDDVVRYCRAHGVTIFAAAGNEHVRVDRVAMTIGGRTLSGVGRVSTSADGIATTPPGANAADLDRRGLLEAPAGVPGVVMVSATNNGNGAAPSTDPFAAGMHVGARDQLAYYSNYGSRVDLAAPGGARRFNLPGWDGGDGNILYGGWGSLGALALGGRICGDPIESSLFNFACFKATGNGFGWLQGTSMSAPNALGVAALVISAKPALRHDPDDLVARLEATARRTMTNYTGPNDPANTATTYDGRPCATGYCHLDTSSAIGFTDAYGAGLVDAGAAVGP
jgi:lantibiotic leader peptide-processing serine protease